MERLFILGHPVAHSKSPAMHNAAYRALGLDWRYGFADCPSEGEARSFLGSGDWLGINVTMPYKPLALEVATLPSAAATLASGANVLARRDGELLADNTDGRGCVSYLKMRGTSFEGASVVVCGTGPTSLSLMHAAAHAGATSLALLGRSADKARSVLDGYRMRAADLADLPDAEYHAGSYAFSRGLLEQADIILDATPLGMKPDDPAPFDTDVLSRGQVVFDVVYGHGETALVRAAKHVGCDVYDGGGMLVAQAVETVRDFTSWLDVPVDCDAVDLFAIMEQAFAR